MHSAACPFCNLPLATIGVFDLFYQPIKSLLLGMKRVFKQKDKCLVPYLTNMCNFHPLEVVGRGSQTQLQVGKNLNYTI